MDQATALEPRSARAFDPEKFKAATRKAWNLAAPGWNAQTPHIHDWLEEATEEMLNAAGIVPGTRVLDIAAGAGDQTLEIARRVQTEGYVLATDIAPEILKLAQENAQRAGFLNVQTRVADAENLGMEAAGFDAAICRLGLMLCPDPLKALRSAFSAVRPGGAVCTLVFSDPRSNPCVGILVSTAHKYAGSLPGDPYEPGSLLSLGKPGLIDALFSEAGFIDVSTRAVRTVFHMSYAREYLDFVRTSAAPILQLLAGLAPAEQTAAWKEMEKKLKTFQTPRGWNGPNELLLTVGRRPLQ